MSWFHTACCLALSAAIELLLCDGGLAHAQQMAQLSPDLEAAREVTVTIPTPSSAQPTSEPSPSFQVSFGDTLMSLSAHFDVPVEELAQRNRLTLSQVLLVGQALAIPNQLDGLPRFQLYTVAPGDTLLSIAARYSVSPHALRRLNSLACHDCLTAGQLLRLPLRGGSRLPEALQAVEVAPSAPKQGEVFQVRLRANAPLRQIDGSFDARRLNFTQASGKADEYVALMGVSALHKPGIYALTIRTIDDNGFPTVIQGYVEVGRNNFGVENLTLKGPLASLLDPEINEQESKAISAIFNQFSGTQYWDAPLQTPVKGKVVSPFGAQRTFNGGVLYTFHSGVDFSSTTGRPVRAPAAGRVVAVEQFQVRGLTVILDHGRGVFTLYAHLSKSEVTPGQFVQAGDVIARTGNTGRTLGPHLHWELAVGGVHVDPLPWLEKQLP